MLRRAGVLALLAIASCHSAPVAPVIPRSTPQGPSQSVTDARRDGVPLQVARMTLDQRTALDVVGSPSVTTDEGIWDIARPLANPPYGEILLLDQRRTTIIKAFPLPGAPPFYLSVTDNAVYCAQPSSGKLPDATVCRIDRRSHTMTTRTFPHGSLQIDDFTADASGVWAKNDKGTWTRLDPTTLAVVATGLAKPG